MKTKNKILGIVFVFWLAGCTFAKHKAGAGANDETSADLCTTKIDYASIQQSIIAPKCLACHSAGGSLLSLETYAAVQSNITKIQAAVQSGRMPPGKPLSVSEKNLLTAWVNAKTPEVAAALPDASCSTTDTAPEPVLVLAPNFESISKLILEPRCVACHDDTSDLDFSSYAKILENQKLFQAKPGEDGDFIEAVASGYMPPKNPKLTEEEISVLRQWVLLGLPERAGAPGVVIGGPISTAPVGAPPPVVLPPPNPIDTLPSDLACIDFEFVKTNIFEPKCVGCHGGSGGVDLDTYANIKPHVLKIENVIATNKMPPKKPLDSVLKEQLLAWIKNGAPEKSTCAPPVVEPPPPLEATYNSMRIHFLEAKCIVCHSGSAFQPVGDGLKKGNDDDGNDDDDEKPDFSTYVAMISNKKLFDFKKPHKSKIVDEVLDGDMPPPSSSVKPLTKVEIDTLIKWINKGLPEG